MYRDSQKGWGIEQLVCPLKKEGTNREEKFRKEVLEILDMKFVTMEAENGAVISSLYKDMEHLIPVTLKEKAWTQQEIMFSTQGKIRHSLP